MIVLPQGASEAERLAALPEEEQEERIEALLDAHGAGLDFVWPFWARAGQLPPKGDWSTWLIMAGRGFGKTRAGAEWVRLQAEANREARIALVAATLSEARAVMVEGESGILTVCPPGRRPKWEPALGRLRWPNGARAFVYSAAEPDSLRGPQHHAAWADEIAKWGNGEAVWDNLMLGLRLGWRPRAVATTTPKPVALVRRLQDETGATVTHGRTRDNAAHLADGFLARVSERYGGTRLGRQELDGELIEEVEGALWTRALIERCRVGIFFPEQGEEAHAKLARSARPFSTTNPPPAPPCFQGGEHWRRVVVGVDPPASAEGTCGIVACGRGADGIGYVLGDHSVGGLSPDGWARAVVRAAGIWGAERVAVETNQGGDMVASVLRGADPGLPVRPVRARFGKSQRAEPVAALFERGEAKFAGAFPELEDELAGLTIGGGYEGPGRSPDRADAMVWAMTELMVAVEQAVPRVRAL